MISTIEIVLLSYQLVFEDNSMRVHIHDYLNSRKEKLIEYLSEAIKLGYGKTS